MKFKLEEYNRNISDRELIEDLEKVAYKLHKKVFTIEDYKKHGRFSYSTPANRFGGCLNALEKAGLKKTREYNIPEEEWFRNLEEVWIKLGRQPYPSDMGKPLSIYFYARYKRK